MCEVGSVTTGSLNRDKIVPQSLRGNKIIPQTGSSGSSNTIFTL